MNRLTIVVPCYNEEFRICTDEYRCFLFDNPVNILFVNDGSTDNTLGVLQTLKDDFPTQVQIIKQPRNMGKAHSVRAGVLMVAFSGKTDFVGFMDADLSTPLEESIEFMAAFNRRNLKCVFGSRIAKIGSRIQRFHHRHYLGRVIASAISMYLKIPIYDSQCGAKFFEAEFAREIFYEPFVSKWLFDVEIFRRIQQSGRELEDCCLELPLTTWIEKGDSRLGIRDFVRLPLEFYRIYNHYRAKGEFVRSQAPGMALPIRSLDKPAIESGLEIGISIKS